MGTREELTEAGRKVLYLGDMRVWLSGSTSLFCHIYQSEGSLLLETCLTVQKKK